MVKVTSINHPADKYLVPNEIKLGYRTITIEPKLMDDFGEYLNNENKILYNSRSTSPELVNTILHELLHAIVEDRLASLVSHRNEETIVNALANGLMTVLVDNPLLLKFFNNNIKEIYERKK
tara:strand:+ start:210 stop:575 length:366 start_codon:yes stop_codon:yes gene_type:complete